jgi:hypothetical protein
VQAPRQQKRRGPFEADIQSYDKSIKGFKIYKAEWPNKNDDAFKKDSFTTLINPEKAGRSQALQEITSVVTAIKSELPNTKKRMQKLTYRNILITSKGNEKFNSVSRGGEPG